MSIPGGSGFSAWSEPSRPRPVLRSGPRDNQPRYTLREATHRDCGYSGPAEHLEALGYYGFDCPKEHGGCGAHVVLWDDGLVEEDVTVITPRLEGDENLWPPSSLEDRGDVA